MDQSTLKCSGLCRAVTFQVTGKQGRPSTPRHVDELGATAEARFRCRDRVLRALRWPACHR